VPYATNPEIPNARFVSLAGHSHLSAFDEADALILPHIRSCFAPRRRHPAPIFASGRRST
jgi:hypothetical protein